MADEQTEKPKITRGIMATLPPHAQDEMREANRELGMALEVVRGIVDAAVAESLPPGKVTELVVRKRREDDEAALARRRGGLKGDEPIPRQAVLPPEAAHSAQIVGLMHDAVKGIGPAALALKDSLKGSAP